MNRLSIAILAAGCLAACNTEQTESINVAVFPSLKICTIKEAPFDCAKAGDYLREKLKVKAGRDITVSYAGTETVAKDDTSVEQITAVIKSAGYTKVRAVRYDMK